jgi:Fe2+ transport system protein FeoA
VAVEGGESVQEKPLSRLKSGERERVAYFAGLGEQHIRKLLTLGIVPGVEVEVLQVSPTLVIRFEHTQLALDYELASHIYVVRR